MGRAAERGSGWEVGRAAERGSGWEVGVATWCINKWYLINS